MLVQLAIGRIAGFISVAIVAIVGDAPCVAALTPPTRLGKTLSHRLPRLAPAPTGIRRLLGREPRLGALALGGDRCDLGGLCGSR